MLSSEILKKFTSAFAENGTDAAKSALQGLSTSDLQTLMADLSLLSQIAERATPDPKADQDEQARMRQATRSRMIDAMTYKARN